MTNLNDEKMLAKFNAMLEREEKARQRAKEYRERNKEKCDAWSERARVRASILCQKAKDAGIRVTDEEIDEYLSKR